MLQNFYHKLTGLTFYSFIFVALIICKFISGLSFDIGLLSLIFSFLLSFSISNFLLNKFKYSENIYIRFFQRFLIYNIVLFLFIFVFLFFNLLPTFYFSSGEEYYEIKINKNLVDNTLQTVGEATKISVEKIGFNMGAGAAAGQVAGQAFKATSGLPPLQRSFRGEIGIMALVTAASVKLGLEIGSLIL